MHHLLNMDGNRPTRASRLCTAPRKLLSLLFVGLAMLLGVTLSAAAQQVNAAGFAFGGDYGSAPQRFPYTFKLDQSLKAGPGKTLTQQVMQKVLEAPKPHLQFLAPDTLTDLKAADQALLSVLLMTGESVSTEQFGAYFKTFINLRGDALIFDFKSKTVVRSYPISVTLYDASAARPTEAELEALVSSLILRADGGGLVTQYVRRMEAATLPTPATRTFQVRRATVGPEALALLPPALRASPELAGQVFSDAFGAVLSARLGISLLPGGMGHAMGSMSLRLHNGDDIELKVGEGDYLFELAINNFVKVKSGENAVGASFVYGVKGNMRFYEPALNTDYLRTDIKNGEVKVIPGGQVGVDDYPAYEAALRGLFLKFAASLNEPADLAWITTAAADKNIGAQLTSTRAILKASK